MDIVIAVTSFILLITLSVYDANRQEKELEQVRIQYDCTKKIKQ